MNGHRKALVALAVAIGLLATAAPSASATVSSITEPDQDAFYQPAPGYETKAPGTVLKKRSVTVTGLGIPLPVKAFQLQSRSTDAKNRPVTVTSEHNVLAVTGAPAAVTYLSARFAGLPAPTTC